MHKDKLRVKITGYAYLDIPDELKDKELDEIEEEMQDDISDIDCGVLEWIESECEGIV